MAPIKLNLSYADTSYTGEARNVSQNLEWGGEALTIPLIFESPGKKTLEIKNSENAFTWSAIDISLTASLRYRNRLGKRDETAGALITAVPVVVLFQIAQRYIVGGITVGAVKG